MPGYWRDPAATEEALRGGWLHTGDVGYFDDQGFLFLLDRAKDMIISGGNNVYPREVEEVIIQHPGVASVVVFGVPHAYWGEAVHAVVVGAASPLAPIDERARDEWLALSGATQRQWHRRPAVIAAGVFCFALILWAIIR